MFGFRRSSKSSVVPPSSDCLDNNNSTVSSETNGLDPMSNSANNGRGDQGSTLHSSDAANLIAEDFEDDVVGCTSTFQSYCSEWEKLFVKQDYLKYVKSIGLRGGLRSSRFRSVAWKLFLGVLPADQTLWLSKTDEWRRQYEDLKNTLIINPRNAEAKDLSINNPLSQEVESPWNQFFLDNELRLTIKQDVIRTYPDVPFFAEDRIHNMMIDILFCYGRKYSYIEYRQGMHELLAPLIFVLHCDHQAFMHACEIESVGDLAKDVLNPEFLEHDAFSMFCQIMQTVDSWYVSKETLPPPPKVHTDLSAQPFTQTQDVHPSNVIVSKLVHIQDNLLKKVDYDLYDHLLKMDIAPQIYGIRWLRLLFGREFPMQDLLILWDAIFADSLTFDLVDYVFVAMLSYLKHALLSSDYPSCLRLLMRYPPISDIQYFIRKSLKLRNPQEFPQLVDYFHKKSVESGANGCDNSAADTNSSARRGSGRGSSLAQSLTSLSKISLKRPGSLGLNRSSTSILSKSTSEPMNLITDTIVTPDRVVVDIRKASTASLSMIEGAFDPRYPGSLRPNHSSHNLAHFEPDAMSSSMIEQMSAASGDAESSSPKTGRFSFFGTRGARKSSVKAKPPKKNMDQEVTLTPSLVSNIDGTCRRCAAELDYHIGTIQKFVLRQNSFEQNDEILLALAGIKQVRDVLKGVLKPSDMYSNPEVVYCGNSPGIMASSQHFRKQQMSSAQSSLAATPLYETATGKFFIATPDLLSSDTDINSPENGALFPEAIGMGRNPSNDTIVYQDAPASEMDVNYHSRGDHGRITAGMKGHRRETSKGNGMPSEIRFHKSLPETVMLSNSEVEMVDLQKGQEGAAREHELKSSGLPILGAYAAEKHSAASSASNATIPAQRTEIYNSVPVTTASDTGDPLLGSATGRDQEQCGNSSQTRKLNDVLKNFTSFK